MSYWYTAYEDAHLEEPTDKAQQRGHENGQQAESDDFLPDISSRCQMKTSMRPLHLFPLLHQDHAGAIL